MDTHYSGVLRARKRASTKLPLTAEPNGAGADIAAACEKLLQEPGIRRALMGMLDALGKGYSVSEIMWQSSATGWKPSMIVWRDPRFFQFMFVSLCPYLYHYPRSIYLAATALERLARDVLRGAGQDPQRRESGASGHQAQHDMAGKTAKTAVPWPERSAFGPLRLARARGALCIFVSLSAASFPCRNDPPKTGTSRSSRRWPGPATWTRRRRASSLSRPAGITDKTPHLPNAGMRP